MVNPDTLVDAIVAVYRDIPELVTALGSDATRIFAYKDAFASASSVVDAAYELKNLQIMVVYQGFGRRNSSGGTIREAQVQEHHLSLFARIPSSAWHLLQDGVPASGSGNPVQYEEIVTGCDPMGRGNGPSGHRESLPIQKDSVLDYLQFDFSLIEK